MESQFLESFVSVVKYGSIAEAARRLDITAAALALRVHALENEFGAPLLQRSGRTVVPTEAGARVLTRAQAVLRDIHELRMLATNACMTGQLRIGAIASATVDLLPRALANFSVDQPRTDVFVQSGVSSGLYTQVCDGELDAALIVEPHFEIPKTCDWITFEVQPLVLLTAAQLSVTDPHLTLIDQPMVRHDRNQWSGRIADDYLRHSGIIPTVRYEVDSFVAVAVLVRDGLGVALIPDCASNLLASLALRKHALPLDGFTRKIGLLWSKATIRSRQIDSLIAAALSAVHSDHV
jgi:DNA-binding transcriptional LysR family regulator